ncbi:hypothetical protein DN412_03605 [Cupriavidus lacunae]|uniref:HTH lysR-type domain-containing protein n=2 Tax=Cupriavidus lacunae TaxID=2666307 RepID=A0A370P0R5_9BURK|nr:hypothetical protein DN412_03605 [Cupriavidus lacunae]
METTRRHEPDIDIEAVRLLVSISELRSFKSAAERHRMTVSNVSNRIRKLESDFGAQVLRRTTRTLELTPLGHRLVGLGESIAHELAVAEGELARIGSQFGGTLTVSVTDELMTWLAPLILQVAQDNPRLRVSLISDSQAGTQTDIRVKRVSKSSTRGTPISMVICQSMGAAIAPGTYSAADLLALPICALGHTTAALAIDLNTARSRVQVEVTPCFMTTDIEVLLQAVEHGVGLGLIPELVFRSSASRSRFRLLLTDHRMELSTDAYDVVVSDREHSKAVVRHVSSMLEQQLKATRPA